MRYMQPATWPNGRGVTLFPARSEKMGSLPWYAEARQPDHVGLVVTRNNSGSVVFSVRTTTEPAPILPSLVSAPEARLNGKVSR